MPPKNKALLISQVREVHPELDEDQLSQLKIVQLLALLKEPVVVEKIPEEPEEESLESLVDRLFS